MHARVYGVQAGVNGVRACVYGVHVCVCVCACVNGMCVHEKCFISKQIWVKCKCTHVHRINMYR